MNIRITDLNTRTTYIATRPEDCQGVDRHAYLMSVQTGDVITMGKVIADPTCQEPHHDVRDITTTHTLRSPCGWDSLHFRPSTQTGMMDVQWVEVDDGGPESGPSCRSVTNTMTIAQARQDWKDGLREGWTPDR